MSESRVNVLHVEWDPDSGLRLYIDDGTYVLADGDEAEALNEVWERDGVLFIPIPLGDDIHED